MTQETVSEAIELAPRYISDIERNKSKGSIDTLVKLCNLYQVTPTFVLQNYLTTPSTKDDNFSSEFSKLPPLLLFNLILSLFQTFKGWFFMKVVFSFTKKA